MAAVLGMTPPLVEVLGHCVCPYLAGHLSWLHALCLGHSLCLGGARGANRSLGCCPDSPASVLLVSFPLPPLATAPKYSSLKGDTGRNHRLRRPQSRDLPPVVAAEIRMLGSLDHLVPPSDTSERSRCEDKRSWRHVLQQADESLLRRHQHRPG